MKNIVKISALLSLLVLLFIPAVVFGQKEAGLQTVPAVDLDRYVGRWFEIAKYPNKFQKKCVADTTATYSRKTDGNIQVVNECVKSDGTKESATGEAKIVKGSGNAKLKVRFAPGFLSFIPAVWGDYWVLDLGPGYEYAVIGDPEREYLWILSRTPEIDEDTYQRLLRKVESLGFAPSRLERTSQNASSLKGRAVGDR